MALQPKPLKVWQKYLVKYFKPSTAITPSLVLKNYWDSIKIKNQLTSLYTSLENFYPLENKDKKNELRKEFGLPIDAKIVLHLGHFNEGRNLESLIPLQKAGYQLVIVGSSSTPADAVGPDSIKEKPYRQRCNHNRSIH